MTFYRHSWKHRLSKLMSIVYLPRLRLNADWTRAARGLSTSRTRMQRGLGRVTVRLLVRTNPTHKSPHKCATSPKMCHKSLQHFPRTAARNKDKCEIQCKTWFVSICDRLVGTLFGICGALVELLWNSPEKFRQNIRSENIRSGTSPRTNTT